MGPAIGLREDFDAATLRRLARASKSANQARRLLAMAHHDHRATQMGPWAVINAGWYNLTDPSHQVPIALRRSYFTDEALLSVLDKNQGNGGR